MIQDSIPDGQGVRHWGFSNGRVFVIFSADDRIISPLLQSIPGIDSTPPGWINIETKAGFNPGLLPLR